MTKSEWNDLLEKRPVILDGATGSNLIQAGMPRGVCTEQWIIDNPKILIELQRGYAEAGSQIVYAPTFAANAINLKGHGLADKVEEMNQSLVDVTRQAVGGRCLIAGDITTTGQIEIDYDELYEVYAQQITSLCKAGADLLVAETMIGVQETMAVLDAAHGVCDLPVMCSLTVEADGSLFFGGHILEAVVNLEEMGADAVGINCSVGPDQLVSVVANIKKNVKIPVLVKPNAGMPVIDGNGEAIYQMGAEEFANHMARLVEAGADLIGGCCGTTPEYIREVRKRVF